jgi:hypothetical protein
MGTLSELLERYEKGKAYMDNKKIALEEKEKWVGEFRKIINQVGKAYDDGLIDDDFKEIKQ